MIPLVMALLVVHLVWSTLRIITLEMRLKKTVEALTHLAAAVMLLGIGTEEKK